MTPQRWLTCSPSMMFIVTKATHERLTSSEVVFAPAYIDIEVVAALRGLARRSDVLAANAPALIERWLRIPVWRMPFVDTTASRIWQLRANMTAYGATASARRAAHGIPDHLRP